MKRITGKFREPGVGSFSGRRVLKVNDYLSSISTDLATGITKRLNLPQSDVVHIKLESNCEIVVRPSGTEPKLKCYLTARAEDITAADSLVNSIKEDFLNYIKDFSEME